MSATPPTPASSVNKSSTLALVGLIIAVSMTTIDQTIVALTAPTIESDLKITHSAMQWAVNAYLIATAAFFLLGGRLADVFGHKKLAIIGIIGFGSMSLLCGLAPNGDMAATWLIVFRILQGIAGALMFPAAIGIVVEGFSREKRAGAMATFFAITGAMTAIGPIAGGYLSQWTWRSVFWINVPLAVAAAIIVAIAAKPGVRRHERIDYAGAAIIAVGLGLIIFGLQQAGQWGWTSPWVIGSLILGLALVAVFVWFEQRRAHPLVRLAVFKDRGFVIATASLLFSAVAFLSTFYFLSVYGQVSLQLSAVATGLLLLTFFIGFVVAAQLGSRHFDKHGGRGVIIIGGVIGVIGFAWLAQTVSHIPSDPGAFFNSQTIPIILAGAGIGYMLSAASTDAVNRAVGASYGEVTAISQTMRNFGGALGIAVFTTVVAGALSTKITASFTALGATKADAQAAIARIGGTVSGDDDLSHLPKATQEKFLEAVQQGYADAVTWAFYGAALAMLIVVILGLLYPKGENSALFTDEAPAPSEPEPAS